MPMFMVRYGEIGLKSQRVRSRFESALRDNIASRFVAAGKECGIESDRGRLYVWSDDAQFTELALSRTFGIVSFSQARETTSQPEDIFSLAVEVSKPLFRESMRFCIRARRSGQHRYTSMELARDAGSAVYVANEHLHPKVDLTNPELEIFVEVRQNKAYVYTGIQKGPGGMPLGTQGRILGIVEQPTDIAACWLLMKRGCRVIVSDSHGHTGPLNDWDPKLRVVEGPEHGNIETLARRYKATGICLGWDVGTFDSKHGELAEVGMPVFYPLIGMASEEIRALMEKIGA